MLYSPDIVGAVARNLGELGVQVVVDPVMVATVGASLHVEGFLGALRERLLPVATLVTPNLDEASALVGRDIEDVEAMEAAAETIHSLGPPYVLVKGGHLKGELVDVLYDGRRHEHLRGYRFPKELHGSGCVLSSLTAAGLALGRTVPEAVAEAHRRVAAGFQTSYAVGGGVEAINPMIAYDRYDMVQAVASAAQELKALLPIEAVPEVGINVGYALPAARTPEDVCGLPGRLVRIGRRLETLGCPEFGASQHVARIILAAMTFNPTVRSAANLRYTPDLLGACGRLGFRLGSFDRADEPGGVSTMEWGTTQAIKALGEVPDVIYDLGGHGKVAMIRVLGRDPGEVVAKIRRIVGPRT
jgi:hydroxymethylpyrimidine/phosphomethylpyrimidine kinase